MNPDETKTDWTRLDADDDPLWAVLVAPDKRNGKRDPDEDDFLAVGTSDEPQHGPHLTFPRFVAIKPHPDH